MTIAELAVGDRVQLDDVTGTVLNFDRDTVTIAWEHGETWRYTDEALKAHGITRWSPVRRVGR